MNLVRTVAPSMLFGALLLGCGGNDKQAKAPQTTAGESMQGVTSSSTMSQPSGSMTTPTTPSTESGMQNPNMNMNSPSGTTTTNSGDMGGMPGSPSGSTGSSGSSMSYTESDIAAILAAVNNGEIEAGKLAQKKAKDARVKRFAAMMVSQHQSANTKQNETLKKLGLTASENSMSRDLTSEGASDIESLKSQSGADFDKAYMDAMVRGHQKALSMLDDKLLPAAKSPEMKAQLQSVRGTVDAHLREATDIQKALSTTK